MTTLLRSHRRAEDFAARVDGTVTPLRRTPAGADGDRELDSLVGTVQVLRRRASRDEAMAPRDAFVTDLRERLMAEAVVVLTPQKAALALPVRTRTKRERRLVAAASAAVLLGGTAGMAAAAQHSLPGEALYPIKRGLENSQTGLSTSPAGRGRDLLAQAGDRLTEVQGLMSAGSGSDDLQVPVTLEDFTAQARQGSDLMLTSYADTRSPATVAELRAFAARKLRILEGISGTAPTEAQPALRAAVMTLREIDAGADRACATCSDLPPLQVPGLFLASAEVDRAMAGLDTARLNNDHPVVVTRRAVTHAAKDQDASRSAAKKLSSSTASAPSAPSAPSTSGNTAGSGGAILPVAPGTPKVKPTAPALAKPKVAAKNVTPDPLDDLEGGLRKATETLLPGAGSSPTLP